MSLKGMYQYAQQVAQGKFHGTIEERDGREVTHVKNIRLAPEGAKVYNPAFDVTPHALIAGIITERGIARAPYTESLAAIVGRTLASTS